MNDFSRFPCIHKIIKICILLPGEYKEELIVDIWDGVGLCNVLPLLRYREMFSNT